MDLEQKKNCKFLQSVDSQKAANWLLEECRPKGMCFYVSKRTWKKQEQIRLAEYFLASIPHSSARCYISLLESISVSIFVKAAIGFIEKLDIKEHDLVAYYMPGAVERACKTEKDLDLLHNLKQVLKIA